jgi:Fe-S oxidoreductase
MKIHFGFTIAGDRSAIEAARRVVRLLEEAGHEVLTRHPNCTLVPYSDAGKVEGYLQNALKKGVGRLGAPAR